MATATERQVEVAMRRAREYARRAGITVTDEAYAEAMQQTRMDAGLIPYKAPPKKVLTKREQRKARRERDEVMGYVRAHGLTPAPIPEGIERPPRWHRRSKEGRQTELRQQAVLGMQALMDAGKVEVVKELAERGRR